MFLDEYMILVLYTTLNHYTKYMKDFNTLFNYQHFSKVRMTMAKQQNIFYLK